MSKPIQLPDVFRDIQNAQDRLKRLEQYAVRSSKPEQWRVIGSPGQPAFRNAWVNYGVSYSTAAFYVDSFERVYFKGLIKSGVIGSDCFILPAEFRPNSRLLMSTISNNHEGRVDIHADGFVVPNNPSESAWVALDGISFRIGS